MRSGSKAERATQKWSTEAHLVLKNTFDWLVSNYAEGRHRAPFEDVLNILILNNKEEYKNCEAFLVSSGLLDVERRCAECLETSQSSIAERLPPKPDVDQSAAKRTSQELRLASGGDQSVLLSRALFT